MDTWVVGETEAERIAPVLGLDTTGWTHAIDAGHVRHAMKQHGDPAKENPRGQIAITAEDLARIPEFIATADRVLEGDDNPRNMVRVKYEKDENGYTVVIEEMQTGQKRLAFVTMRKHKRGGGGSAAPDEYAPPPDGGKASPAFTSAPGAERSFGGGAPLRRLPDDSTDSSGEGSGADVEAELRRVSQQSDDPAEIARAYRQAREGRDVPTKETAIAEVLRSEPIPTPVGVNRTICPSALGSVTYPHARGGEPEEDKGEIRPEGLSPRPWG